MMKINIAKSAGFCFGVKRAVDTVYKESSKKNVYTFGPIIHNDEVVADLERQGVHVINDSEDFKSLSEGTIIIRSHGVSKAIYDEILNAGLDLNTGFLHSNKKKSLSLVFDFIEIFRHFVLPINIAISELSQKQNYNSRNRINRIF